MPGWIFREQRAGPLLRAPDNNQALQLLLGLQARRFRNCLPTLVIKWCVSVDCTTCYFTQLQILSTIKRRYLACKIGVKIVLGFNYHFLWTRRKEVFDKLMRWVFYIFLIYENVSFQLFYCRKQKYFKTIQKVIRWTCCMFKWNGKKRIPFRLHFDTKPHVTSFQLS